MKSVAAAVERANGRRQKRQSNKLSKKMSKRNEVDGDDVASENGREEEAQRKEAEHK